MAKMRVLEQLALSPEVASSAGGAGAGGLHSWFVDCHGLWYTLTLAVPCVLFVAYLASQARRSFNRLAYGRSYIMIAYYALLWIVTGLNFAWCLLQEWQCTPGKEVLWNMLTLFTTSGMLFLEISLVAFLLQGNHAAGFDSLTHTFIISGVIIAADIVLKAIYVFGFGIPLFIDANETPDRVKWGLWIVHKLMLTAVYGFILFMYHSKWRERLPAKPAYYNYIGVMFWLSVISLFACVLAGNGAGFGFWLYNLTTVCYHSLYLPLIYMTFLADFFQEDDFRLENVYYSEMKDAGFFDADWD